MYTTTNSISARQNQAKLIQLAVVLALGCTLGWTLTAIAPLRAKQVVATPPAAVVTSTAPSLTAPPRRSLSPLLYHQGLSHVAFHTNVFKLRLASLVKKYNRVAVVGVEWGTEVRALGSAGYEVHAFEPLTKFHDNTKNIAIAAGWNVHMYKVAASATSGGTIELKYDANGVLNVDKAKLARVDDYLSSKLDVMSVDIQGNEYDVLVGASNLISAGKVRSLWIEVFPCNPKVNKIFDLLDEKYVIFDFVPWGRLKDSELALSWTERSDAVERGWNTRPSKFNPYLRWLCENQKFGFRWSQTDIMAIRRDLVTPQLLHSLANLGNDVLVKMVTAPKK